MSAQPAGPVHPADRPLRGHPAAQALQDAEDAAAAQNWLAREARGETNYVPLPQVRHRLRLVD